MLRTFVVALSAAGIASSSYATPITITQTFSDVTFNDYGVVSGVGYGQSPTDPWVFKGVVDSEATRTTLYPGYSAYELTSLTITQASLGLFDVGIRNVPMLFFFPNSFGFAYGPAGSPPWTQTYYDYGHFSAATTLSEDLALITTPYINSDYSSFAPQWDGFELEDGRRIYGWGHAGAASAQVSSVPEPTSLALILIGLTAASIGTIRRKTL